MVEVCSKCGVTAAEFFGEVRVIMLVYVFAFSVFITAGFDLIGRTCAAEEEVLGKFEIHNTLLLLF
jgi:hypothetical protein